MIEKMPQLSVSKIETTTNSTLTLVAKISTMCSRKSKNDTTKLHRTVAI